LDALMLHELCENNPEWETAILADGKGIFIGSLFDLKALVANTDMEEE
jgi:hypothetical protein